MVTAQSKNRTRGSSCLLRIQFISLMYSSSCPFRRCGLLSFHRRTNNHGPWEYRILLRQACLEEAIRWRHKVLFQCVRFPRSRSTNLIFFPVCTCLRFSSSTGRWRYRWDLLDKKIFEKDISRRHGGMYPIVIYFFIKPPFWHCFEKPFMVYKTPWNGL